MKACNGFTRTLLLLFSGPSSAVGWSHPRAVQVQHAHPFVARGAITGVSLSAAKRSDSTEGAKSNLSYIVDGAADDDISSLTREEENTLQLLRKELLSPPSKTALLSETKATATPTEFSDAAKAKGPKDISAVLTNFFVLGITTASLVNYWNGMLVDFEWMQAWRYIWPCVGLVFVYEGYDGLAREYGLPRLDNRVGNDDIENAEGAAPTDLASETVSLRGGDFPVWLRAAAVAAGASLAIGGAADAFLPVYVTGPNFITKAGLAPDAAAFLAVFQALVLSRRVWLNKDVDVTVCAAHVLLLSQLLVLGAGSFDDVATLVVEEIG